MRIGVAQNVGWSAGSAESEPKQAEQVLPERHKQPPQERRCGEVGNDAERVRWLVPGEDKVENVHEQCGPKRCLCQVGPRTAPPGTPLGLIRWLFGHTAPTQAQSEGHKDEEQ